METYYSATRVKLDRKEKEVGIKAAERAEAFHTSAVTGFVQAVTAIFDARYSFFQLWRRTRSELFRQMNIGFYITE